MKVQRAAVGAALVMLLTLAGCSGSDEQPEPPVPPVESAEPLPAIPDAPEPDATAPPGGEEAVEPVDLAASWLVADDYFAQFPVFEPLRAGASSDHVADITSGTWTFPDEATAGYVQLTSRETGDLHVLPSQGESATDIGFSASYNSFGEVWFPHRVELVYNVVGANPTTGDLDTNLNDVTHLYLNTVWSDWEAVLRPIADVPELSQAIAGGMRGTAGSYMFRHNGEPIAVRVLTEDRIQGDLSTTDGDDVAMFGVSPKTGDTEGHVLIPAGSAWVNLRFDGDWELGSFDGVMPLGGTTVALDGADQVLYTHDGSAVTVDNDHLDLQYHPISITGEDLTVLTGERLEFPADTWWVYARPIPVED